MHKTRFKTKFLLFLFISTLFYLRPAFSTNNDTTYIYETVVTYDTVVIYDTVFIEMPSSPLQPILDYKTIAQSILNIDTVKHKATLTILSENKSATIPIKSIILNENIKNIEDMKKLSFLSVILFAMQNILFAQTEFGISAGSGIWWARSQENVNKVSFSPTYKLGAFVKSPLSNKFFIDIGADFRFLTNNNSFKSNTLIIGWDNPYCELNDTAITLCHEVGVVESSSNFAQISIPVNFSYQLSNFHPHLGLEYSFRISEQWMDSQLHLFGVNVGCTYKFSKHLSTSINYHIGLSKEYEYTGYTMDLMEGEYVKEKKYAWRNRRLELSISYTINQSKKEEIKE